MLCSLTLNGLVSGMKDMEWSAGDEYEIVTISINPDEDAASGDDKQEWLCGTLWKGNRK